MTQSRRKARELLRLLPSGVAGLSMSLASADASAFTIAEHPETTGRTVGDRIQSIRSDVAGALEQYAQDAQPFVAVDPELLLAWWGNGWHNGGWHNGGFGNGGFGNGGWHNGGFGNGGWHNGGFRNW